MADVVAVVVLPRLAPPGEHTCLGAPPAHFAPYKLLPLQGHSQQSLRSLKTQLHMNPNPVCRLAIWCQS